MRGIVALSLIGALFSNQSEAAQQDALCAAKAVVYFGNGVFVDPDVGGKLAMRALRDGLKAYLPEAQFKATIFRVNRNPTDGFTDLYEAAIQALQSNNTRFWGTLAGILPMTNDFRDIIGNVARREAQRRIVDGGVVSGQVAAISNELLEGRKAVIVAHSQGNFFANADYAQLSADQRKSVGVVSVANPDDYVAGGGPYTTSVTDIVIGAVRLAYLAAPAIVANPLLPNVAIGISRLDLTGHFFQESYLRSKGDRIYQQVVDELQKLQVPRTDGAPGAITATLTWGAQPDVDLHAFEPSGSHVYYRQLQGPTGKLDIDDTTSFGPEHYTVPCDKVVAGNYRIAVNYFRGNGPENALIQVKAGLDSNSFNVRLNNAVGTSGNLVPRTVANVKVTGDSRTGFYYSISGAGSASQAVDNNRLLAVEAPARNLKPASAAAVR